MSPFVSVASEMTLSDAENTDVVVAVFSSYLNTTLGLSECENRMCPFASTARETMFSAAENTPVIVSRTTS